MCRPRKTYRLEDLKGVSLLSDGWVIKLTMCLRYLVLRVFLLWPLNTNESQVDLKSIQRLVSFI